MAVLYYIFALLPIYVLIYIPLSTILFGTPRLTDTSFVLNSSFIAIEDSDFNPASCPAHTYETHIISQEPLLIYIENFLSLEERAHLITIRYIP